MSSKNVDLVRSSLEAWSARLHGHGSGIVIDVSETYAVLVEDGRIRRVDEYRTLEQALEAVGPPVA